MNLNDQARFVERLTDSSDGAMILNRDQLQVLRRRLLPLTNEQADRAIRSVYEVRDRMAMSALMPALIAANTTDTTTPYHRPDCRCEGDGWIDAEPLHVGDREYHQLQRCPVNFSRPITTAEWDQWQARHWKKAERNVPRAKELIAAATARIATPTPARA